MTSLESPARATPAIVAATAPGKREQGATRAMFFAAGFATAAWAALVPFAKHHTSVDHHQLGLLILCLGIGALLAMPATGALSSRAGCRRVLVAAVVVFCAMLPLLAVLSNVWVLALALFVFGIGVGTTDCVMNIQAILVEEAADRPLMSGFHGFYSVGGIAGAGLMTLSMSLGATPLAASLAASACMLVLLWVYSDGLLTYAYPRQGPLLALPRGAVVLLGVICFAVFLAEGTVLDWSAVFLTEQRAFDSAMAGVGFACFAATMTVGRLTGDRVVARIGARPVVTGGALLALAGMLILVWVPLGWAALAGYALIGLGCSNIVPVMFSAISRQTSMPQALAVPAVSTLGYLGVLSGPAAIGFVAQASSLPAAFLLVGALLLMVAVASRRVPL